MILQLFAALALTLAALFPLLGCSTVGEAPGPSQMPSSSPDISGVAWIAGSRFLAVHDTKDQKGRPRVSIVELPESPAGLTSQPVELSWPGPHGLASDLESVARIPGTSLILLLESGSGERSGTPLPRIFLVEHRDRALKIVDFTDWPVPVDNVEGAAVARLGEQLIFLFAERAEGQGSTALRWAPVTARPLAFGSFQEVRFTSPDPTGRNARPVTAIEIDEIGRIYVVSAVDPGTDNGPFRSVIWRIGRMEADGSGRPRVILDEIPRQLATVDVYCTRFFGHKTALGSLVGCECCGHPVPPGLGRASVAVLFQQPVLIVAIEVGPDGGADLFDVLVDASKDDLLLQRTDESLGDAVGLGLANEGEAGRHAEELQLVLEVLGHEGTAVVVAQRHPSRGIGADGAEDLRAPAPRRRRSDCPVWRCASRDPRRSSVRRR
jgi:hypothetical protein